VTLDLLLFGSMLLMLIILMESKAPHWRMRYYLGPCLIVHLSSCTHTCFPFSVFPNLLADNRLSLLY